MQYSVINPDSEGQEYFHIMNGGHNAKREKRAASKIKRLFFAARKQSSARRRELLFLHWRANVFPAFAFLWLHHLLLIAPLNETCTRLLHSPSRHPHLLCIFACNFHRKILTWFPSFTG
jgi:hypothetical protein